MSESGVESAQFHTCSETAIASIARLVNILISVDETMRFLKVVHSTIMKNICLMITQNRF